VNIIQLNKFSRLHDGEKIIFCKTDYLLEEFEQVAKKNHDVVLISGNSDYCITNDIVRRAPRNIKKWFCQNKYSDSFLLQSIPIGLDNSEECTRPGHGKAWEHAKQKQKVLSEPPNKKSDKLIYSNFTVQNNVAHRSLLKQISIDTQHITWSEPNVEYPEYVNSILEHQAVLCAQGNEDGDNHRIYETLYLSRVPLSFSPTQYRYLHHLFPTVLITNIEDLYDEKLLTKKISECKKKINNKYLDFDYWKDMILDVAEGL